MIPKKNNNLSKIRNNIDNKNIKANQKKSNSDLYNLDKFEYIPLKYNKYEKENNLEKIIKIMNLKIILFLNVMKMIFSLLIIVLLQSKI